MAKQAFDDRSVADEMTSKKCRSQDFKPNSDMYVEDMLGWVKT